MSHSYVKIWVHAIWSTKNREHLIDFGIEKKLYDFLFSELSSLNCSALAINGMPDHIHCLFLLDNQKSIADVVKQLKGSSAHYINSNDMTMEKFSWQKGYAAFSVSESIVPKVKAYINNQKAHHGAKAYPEELSDFLKLNGFDHS
ncbi:MAG: IS200/IS605 family transposase [Chitinophagaceae bacterium]|jgi:REP element-mobilizing transposase RayT